VKIFALYALATAPPAASSAATPAHTAEFICSALDFQGFAGNQGFSH
jgi:hypothetical protein